MLTGMNTVCYDYLLEENMNIAVIALVAVVSFALGYAFRGSIGKELKVIGTDIKAEFAKLSADLKAKL
jgi:hypothetical protein